MPRWFVDKIVNKNAGIGNPELRQIINEWLSRYGKLFAPLTFGCEEVCGGYSCYYDNAIRQIRMLRDTLMRLHSLEGLRIKMLFVNRYVRAITRVVKELRSINIGREVSNLIIEVHPGFGGPNKSMDLKPIAHGIKRLITGVINNVHSNGFELMVTVESRGSSSTISKREQAAATIDRLEELRKLVEDKLKDFGIPVASVIDVPQLITGYAKVKKNVVRRHTYMVFLINL